MHFYSLSCDADKTFIMLNKVNDTLTLTVHDGDETADFVIVTTKCDLSSLDSLISGLKSMKKSYQETTSDDTI